MGYKITSITSVSNQAMQKRNDVVRFKRGLDIGYTPLVLKRGLLPWILEHRVDIKLIAAKYGVKRIWLTGSVADGTDTTVSDCDFFAFHVDPRFHRSLTYELAEFIGVCVDVLYEGAEGLTFKNYIEPWSHVEL